jgi:predicted RNase H-like HicB family nuclease
MITEYVTAAMRRARYEQIEDPDPYYGEIHECQGVWAVGKTPEECRHALQETLEGWLILRLQKGLEIPELDGIRLTEKETIKHS